MSILHKTRLNSNTKVQIKNKGVGKIFAGTFFISLFFILTAKPLQHPSSLPSVLEYDHQAPSKQY